jgi:hypothetical protein
VEREQVEVVGKDIAAVGLCEDARSKAPFAADQSSFKIESAEQPVFTDVARQDDEGRASTINLRGDLGKTACENRLSTTGWGRKGDTAQARLNSQQQQSPFDRDMPDNGNKRQRDVLKREASLDVRPHGEPLK